MTSFATQPARALPETPENASDPPHWRARRRSPAGSGGAFGGGRLRQPAFEEGERPCALRLVAAADAPEGMEHVLEGIAARGHEPLQIVAGIRPGAVVHREHRAHVGMDHEPREDPQHVVEVVRARTAAAFGVGDGHHPVHPARRPAGRLAPPRGARTRWRGR